MAPRLRPEELFPAGIRGLRARLVPVRLAGGTSFHIRIVEATAADEAGAAEARAGPAVLLLAGWGGSAYLYRHNLLALAAAGDPAGLRVIAADLPGQGLSDKPRDPKCYTIPALADAVLALLDALGIREVRLVGQSLAGGIALHLALTHPERISRLALIAPVGLGRVHGAELGGRFLPAAMGRLLAPLARRTVFKVALRLASGGLARPSERDVDEYHAPTRDPEFVPSLFALLRGVEWRPLAPAELARLELPVLVVWGTRDRVIDFRGLEERARAIPDVQLLRVNGAGHVPNEEAPAMVNPMLAPFLVSRGPAA